MLKPQWAMSDSCDCRLRAAYEIQNMKEKEYSEEFFISANEGNPEGELALNILVDQIIEIATAHANYLGIGNPSMKHLNAGWILSRLTVEMNRYPKVNSSYRLTTWVEGWNRHFSTRDFCITSADGKETYGYARSIWMVLDTVTHENFGTTHLAFDEAVVSDCPCPIERQARHREIVSAGTDESGHMLEATAPVEHYTFKYNDIDFYRHVNTVKYVSLILNQYSLETFDAMLPDRLELSFITEGKYGQTVDILRHSHDDTLTAFSLKGQDEGRQILFARLRLKPREQ